MQRHPYQNLPDHAFWSRAVTRVPASLIDPIVSSPKFIEKHHKIATAGSCFAQHLSRRLLHLNYNYFVAERAHPIVDQEIAKANNYGVFSARYGFIYTPRQLLQLFNRAYGELSPKDTYWPQGHRFVDPLRPTIQPRGYGTIRELEADRKRHLSCVRAMFETLDVFIFTLGLTEAWISSEDGVVYPVCPGVSGGKFDPLKHRFHNFSYEECISDIRTFLDQVKSVNSHFKMILTVSPVPLVATMQGQHVLTSTTYSKSILRVVAEIISHESDQVFYFPSYEIIMGLHSRGAYFHDDLRSIRDAGVDHVISCCLTIIRSLIDSLYIAQCSFSVTGS